MTKNPQDRWSRSHLSDAELEAGLRTHEEERRKTRLLLAAQLAEVEARQLHVKLGYASILDMCLRKFNLDEDDAEELIEMARSIPRPPKPVPGS